jgi:dihydroxy-acid dehydratase
VPDAPRADQDVIADRRAAVRAGPPRDPARQPRAGRLRGQDHGPQEPAITGPARVFDSENEVMDAIMARKIKRATSS